MTTNVLPRNVMLTVGAMLAATVTIQSASRREVPLEERVRGAERIVAGHVMMVRSEFATNEFGDRLIVTRARVVVSEVLKGQVPGSTVEVNIEGGTVGEVTLLVSDMPEVRPGDRVALLLSQNRLGQTVPHLRGQGVFKLDRNGRDEEQHIALDEIRAAARSARGGLHQR